MKTPLFLLLMSLCFESIGATIVVNGQPLPLNYSDNLYYWPYNIAMTPGTKNLFISMDGLNEVCFLSSGPSGTLEQVSEISIILNGMKTDWNCFPYKTTITEVLPW